MQYMQKPPQNASNGINHLYIGTDNKPLPETNNIMLATRKTAIKASSIILVALWE